MKNVEIAQVRTVFDGHFRVEEALLRYQLPDGAMSEVTRRLSLERGDSAAAVVTNVTNGTTLVTRQFRYPTVKNGPGWVLELVAGNVDQGETPIECISREITEEIGYETTSISEICTFYTSPGGSSERIHLFHAVVTSRTKTGAGGGNAEEQEDIEIVEIPVDRIWKVLVTGEIMDAKTIIGLGWLAQRRENQGGLGA